MRQFKAIAASYVGVALFAIPLFLGAGRLAYPEGLRYLALALLGTTFSHALTPAGSDLAAERASRARDGEAWDKRLLAAHAFVSLVMFGVAGLDSGRFGWSGPVPPAVPATGAVAMLAGQALFALARRENAFFSSTVQLQADRGHSVCESGPYRWVRHPGYFGMLASLLAFPLVTASWWAFAPAAAGAGLLIARTALEDRFLTERLADYAAYAARTRWRLVPGVW